MPEINELLIEEIKKALVDNRLSCAKAHELAEKFNVTLPTIGQIAEEQKIKISKCQLGCF